MRRICRPICPQMPGDCWSSLVPIGTRRSSAIPTSPNSHKHIQDSNVLGGTIKPQVSGLSSPISSLRSGYKCLWTEGGCEVKVMLDSTTPTTSISGRSSSSGRSSTTCTDRMGVSEERHPTRCFVRRRRRDTRQPRLGPSQLHSTVRSTPTPRQRRAGEGPPVMAALLISTSLDSAWGPSGITLPGESGWNRQLLSPASSRRSIQRVLLVQQM